MGVIEKRLDAHAAPSGVLLVTGGMVSAMMELSGRARPRMPLKLGERFSPVTLVAAADAAASEQYTWERDNWYT